MLVTDAGHLVVVETKLVQNPESCAKWVAQILSYAMAVSAEAPAERMPAAAIRSSKSSGHVIRKKLPEALPQFIMDLDY